MSANNPSICVVLAVTSDSAFLNLGGVPNLIRAFESLTTFLTAGKIIVATTAKDAPALRELLESRNAPFELLILPSFNPPNLAQSLESHLGKVQAVVIHDASRPLTSKAQFEGVLTAFNNETDAVRPAMAFTETLKIVGENLVIRQTLDRNTVLRISTPELIRVSAIDFAGPDGGWFLPLKKGARTMHIEGSPDGLRINTAEDRDLMELSTD